jgi:2-polyprenyl-3-methyl-5-hydroxy-6-metoxy-1,4-benzoquinol methylase
MLYKRKLIHENPKSMNSFYSLQDSDYLKKTKTWHIEDSPWKAKQIIKMLERNNISPKSVVEIGCGAGEILNQLQLHYKDQDIQFDGYDIAPDAFILSQERKKEKLNFYNEDLLEKEKAYYDVLLMIDVFEHVDDYIGFICRSSTKAKYKIFHIPLDLHVSALLRKNLLYARKTVGHLHYFTKETALATLEDTGLNILDYFFTNSALDLSSSKTLKTKIANIPRRIMNRFSKDLSARLLGGYSLLVLAQ